MAQSAAGILAQRLAQPPPPGQPHGVALPGTERSGRSPIYRHWQVKDKPLVTTLDPKIRTMHELFDDAAQRVVNNNCMGVRKWLPETKTWDNKFTWITYGEVAERRKNFGAGLVELHKRINHPQDKYGIGLWCQNRPEWQITGMSMRNHAIRALPIHLEVVSTVF